ANAAETAARATYRSKIALDSFRVFLTAEEIDVLTENFQVVAKEQERLDTLARNSGENAAKWAQFANRLRVILTETRSLEDVAATSIEHAAGGMNERLKQLNKEINKQRTAMEAALAAKAPSRELLAPTMQMTAAYADLARKVLELR